MGTLNPHFNLQQASAQASSFPSSPSAGSSSDRPHRPGPSSSAYTSSAVPTLQPLSPNQQLTSLSTRPSTSSHSYSRSSPAVGLDPRHMQFPHLPETPKYSASSASKYYVPQTPTGAPSQSPLALSDIRPRNEHQLGDDMMSPGQYMHDGGNLVQTHNSYLAPWATYAYDWCKWPAIGGGSAGKMAICSYLEDPHNYVSYAPLESPKRRNGLRGGLADKGAFL